MHRPKTAIFLVLLATSVNALQAVYAPEDASSTELITEAQQKGINLNVLLDQIIVSARKAFIIAKEDTLALPDFTEDFYQKIWPFVVHGHLNCTKGSLRSLASIQRTGDAKLVYRDSKLLVIAQLGLEELIIDYKYDASILHIGANGDLAANVTSNSVILAVDIALTVEGCKLKMEETKITDFGPITVNLTGLYPFDGLSSAIAEKAADSLHDTIRQAVEQNLQKRLQKVIEKIPCHIPLWGKDNKHSKQSPYETVLKNSA